MKKGNVLMVCLGNICRSPLAHGIFEHLSKDFSITVDSAGTANYHAGNAPDPRSIKTAAAKGINIAASQGRVRPFRSISKSSGKKSLRAPRASSAYCGGMKSLILLIGKMQSSCWNGV